MTHVFISYSHKDKSYADQVARSLEARDLQVFIDDRIDYGSQWPRVIQKKLDLCGAFVLVMTTNSFDSDWVQNELARAKRKRKPIFPLLLEGSEPWLAVEATQYVDVRAGDLPPADFYTRLASVMIQGPPPRERVAAGTSDAAVIGSIVDALRDAEPETEVSIGHEEMILSADVYFYDSEETLTDISLVSEIDDEQNLERARAARDLVESIGWDFLEDEDGDIEIGVERTLLDDQDRQTLAEEVVRLLTRILDISSSDLQIDVMWPDVEETGDAVLIESIMNALRDAEPEQMVSVSNEELGLSMDVYFHDEEDVSASMDLFSGVDDDELQAALDSQDFIEDLEWEIVEDQDGDVEISIEWTLIDDTERRALAEDIVTLMTHIFELSADDLKVEVT